MSKFCGSCGKELDDAAKICGYCGAQLERAPSDIQNESGAKKGIFAVSKIKLAAIAAGALALIIALVIILPGFFGARKIEKKLIKAIETRDAGMLADVLNPEQNTKSVRNSFKSRFEETDDYFEDKVGKNFSIDAEIIDSYNLTREEMISYYNIDDEDEYSEVRGGIIKATVKGSKGTVINYYRYYLFNESGYWYLANLY